MKERRRRNDFPEGIKKDVRHSQQGCCADCGAYCNGHPNSPRFTVHHVLPQALGGSNDRKNAIGLCPRCHEKHDNAAFCEGKLFYETMMEEDRTPEAKVLAETAGLSIRSLTSPNSLRRVLAKETYQTPSNGENPLQNGASGVIYERVAVGKADE